MDLTVTSNTFGSDDRTWLGSAHAVDTADSVTLRCDLFINAGAVVDGWIPSGTVIAKATSGPAANRYGPHDSVTPATNGQQTAAGILLSPVKATAGHDVGGAMIVHGEVESANLPFASTAIGGIAAADYGDLPLIHFV